MNLLGNPMEGQKDEATVRYEREIRFGMLLLGVLAFAFVGVLARRIWMENDQVTTLAKKPVYFTKAERDALRVRAKPLPLTSIHAATEPRRLGQKKSSTKEVEATTADPIPDLEIGDSEVDRSTSSPAAFVDREEENDESKSHAKPPAALPNSSRPSPLKTLRDPTQSSKPEQESSEAEKSKVDPLEELTQPQDDAAKTTETAPALSPAINSPNSTPENDTKPAGESQTEAKPSVRKKLERNPWKPAGAAPKALTARYTVERGDTLKSIAKSLLGDEAKWREIYDLNRAEIGDDFEFLKTGMKLKLPNAGDEPPHEVESAKDAKILSPK